MTFKLNSYPKILILKSSNSPLSCVLCTNEMEYSCKTLSGSLVSFVPEPGTSHPWSLETASHLDINFPAEEPSIT